MRIALWEVVHMPSCYSPESRAGRSRLENARITHTGTYKCIAKNPAGSVWQIAPAKVNIPPRLLVAPGNTAVRIADQVRSSLTMRFPEEWK